MPTQGQLQLKNIVDEVFNPNFYLYCLFISHDLQQKIYQIIQSLCYSKVLKTWTRSPLTVPTETLTVSWPNGTETK